jgi:light-regulated signal transduction histidine kinase (bacteriophytochrome)
VSNALKFSRNREPPRIEISARVEHGERIFEIRDNGVGFDMAYAEKLFGVFNRLHAASEFPGVGVGLAIVRRIVQRHGGRVWAESEVGAGSTFCFGVPVAASDMMTRKS